MSPVLCIASNNRCDEHTIRQISHNIESIRYMRSGGKLLLLEQTNAFFTSGNSNKGASSSSTSRGCTKTVTKRLVQADHELTVPHASITEERNTDKWQSTFMLVRETLAYMVSKGIITRLWYSA